MAPLFVRCPGTTRQWWLFPGHFQCPFDAFDLAALETLHELNIRAALILENSYFASDLLSIDATREMSRSQRQSQIKFMSISWRQGEKETSSLVVVKQWLTDALISDKICLFSWQRLTFCNFNRKTPKPKKITVWHQKAFVGWRFSLDTQHVQFLRGRGLSRFAAYDLKTGDSFVSPEDPSSLACLAISVHCPFWWSIRLSPRVIDLPSITLRHWFVFLLISPFDLKLAIRTVQGLQHNTWRHEGVINRKQRAALSGQKLKCQTFPFLFPKINLLSRTLSTKIFSILGQNLLSWQLGKCLWMPRSFCKRQEIFYEMDMDVMHT